jgi:hypothetical protein
MSYSLSMIVRDCLLHRLLPSGCGMGFA